MFYGKSCQRLDELRGIRIAILVQRNLQLYKLVLSTIGFKHFRFCRGVIAVGKGGSVVWSQFEGSRNLDFMSENMQYLNLNYCNNCVKLNDLRVFLEDDSIIFQNFC